MKNLFETGFGFAYVPGVKLGSAHFFLMVVLVVGNRSMASSDEARERALAILNEIKTELIVGMGKDPNVPPWNGSITINPDHRCVHGAQAIPKVQGIDFCEQTLRMVHSLDEIAWILGHELRHLDMWPSMEAMDPLQLARVFPEFEADADQFSRELLHAKTRYNPMGGLWYFEKVKRARDKANETKTISFFDFFRAPDLHPDIDRRIAFFKSFARTNNIDLNTSTSFPFHYDLMVLESASQSCDESMAILTWADDLDRCYETP